MCIQPALVSSIDQWCHLASMVGGLSDKSSFPSGVFITSQAVHLVSFVE